MQAFSKIRDAQVFAFPPPAVIELGTASGWDLQLQDRAGLGHAALMAARGQFLGLASQHPQLAGVRPNGRDDESEYQVEVDRTYALSALVVFLALAALYESWSVPFAVMVPLGVLGAVLAALGRGLPSDIYFQVGLLATIGLSAKNAILIVEFAKTLQEQGQDAVSAALQAARMRIRPIVMTSLAFGFGVLPLAISTGAGSGGQYAIGTGVLGGVVAGTLLGVLFVPLFFVLIRGRLVKSAPRPASAPAAAVPHAA